MEETTKGKNILEYTSLKDSIPTIESYPSLNWNSHGSIANQFIIRGVLEGTDFKLFQSYSSPIAMFWKGITFIFPDWNYSVTTGKYRNDFLGEKKAETLKKLESGEYKAVGFIIN